MNTAAEYARVMRTLLDLEEKIDSILTWGELNNDQRRGLTDAANHAELARISAAAMNISDVKFHRDGSRYNVSAGGVQVRNNLGLDGATQLARMLTGRSRGGVKCGDGLVDIRPYYGVKHA